MFSFWFSGFRVYICAALLLAAAQMCFCWIKRKPRLKPAKFFIALLSAMPAVTRRSAAEVAYLKSAAATDPPRRIERLFFRFETLVDSERDANWSTVRPAVSRLSTYLPQFESSAAYNLTVNQAASPFGASKTPNDLRRGQRPARRNHRPVRAADQGIVAQIPQRRLPCARIEQDEIRLAIAVKIRRADQSPSCRQSRTVGAADKHVVVHVPDCRLPRARIEQAGNHFCRLC